MENEYPVPGRSEQRNRRIAGHEIGHCFAARALGNHVHLVTIIPGGGFEGKCVRSGPPTQLTFEDQTTEIISVCERLERLAPELGSARVVDSEMIVRAQSMVIELVAGLAAEQILHPDCPSLGAVHDHTEAQAIARVVCAAGASPAVAALVRYAQAEGRELIKSNLDIVNALVEALIEHGRLNGTEIDEIISQSVAARSIRIEHQRRADWQRRCESARSFAAEYVPWWAPSST